MLDLRIHDQCNPGHTVPLRRDVTYPHPSWVHAQLGTANEGDLQAYLDGLDYAIYVVTAPEESDDGLYFPSAQRLDAVRADPDLFRVSVTPSRAGRMRYSAYLTTPDHDEVYLLGEFYFDRDAGHDDIDLIRQACKEFGLPALQGDYDE